MVIQLQKGCCCSLKTATLVIAVLGIVTGLFMIFATATNYEPSQVELSQLFHLFRLKMGGGEYQETFGRIVEVTMAVVQITISTVLVVGAVTSRPKLVYPWIVLNVVQTAFATIILVTLALYVSIMNSFKDGSFIMIVVAIHALIQGYMILVVNSLHNTILAPPTFDNTMNKDAVMDA